MANDVRNLGLGKKLIRTDRNGTKYYSVTSTCYKCGGRGALSVFLHVQSGVCFVCKGSGVNTHTYKEYTTEYAEKLVRTRNSRNARALLARKAEKLAKSKAEYESFGDCVYVILGRISLGGFKTYKEDYAMLTAKSGISYRGHKLVSTDLSFNDEAVCGSEPFAYVAIPKSEVFHVDGEQTDWNEDLREVVTAATSFGPVMPEGFRHESEHKYGVGDKVELELRLDFRHEYESNFGYHPSSFYIYVMKDQQGNVYKWKSNNYYSWDGYLTVKGTVKELGEYKGVKQTVLTRCKVLNAWDEEKGCWANPWREDVQK